MTGTITFGIVGGYGAAGRAVASELVKSCEDEILIGGRDLAKAKALAAELGSRVTAAHLDALDARSLDDFCGRSSLIINCAGPVMVLQDRVAQAAFRNRCHYIDAADLGVVKERMLPHAKQMEDLGLSFVISAGWMPGLSEVLAAYAEKQARTRMDSIESLSVFFGDSGEWSVNALRDAVWFLHHTGLRRAGFFHKGEWTFAKSSQAMRRVDLGGPIGSRRFVLYSTPELAEIARRLKDCDVFIYPYLSGFRTAMATTLMALFPLPEGLGVRLFRSVFRRNRLPVDGFAAARILGSSQGRRQALSVQVVYRDRRDYSIHALVLATVARRVARKDGVRAGVHYLADAVDPVAFLADLRNAGVELLEELKPLDG